MDIKIDPELAYNHAKREGARVIEQMIGDLAAKSAAIDQMAEQLTEVTTERDKLAERLAALEPAKESTNGKPAKDTIEASKQIAKAGK